MYQSSQHSRAWTRVQSLLIGASLSIATAISAEPACAQSRTRPSDPSSFTLSEFIAQVVSRSPRIEAANSLEEAARSRIPASTRPPDPELQLGFMNYTLPNLAPMATIGMPQLQIMQTLPLGGKLRLSGQVTEAQASSARSRTNAVVADLRNVAAGAYYELYAADRQLSITRNSLRLSQDAAATAKSMYELGEGRQTDVLRAQVEVARMVEDTLRISATIQGLTVRMNALRDHDTETAIGRPELPERPTVVPSYRWFDSVAAVQRPVLRAGADDLTAAEAGERLVQRELWPDIQVGVQYGRKGMAWTMPGSDEPMRRTMHMGSLMVGASIPVFARSRQLSMREEANAMLRMARAELKSMQAETHGQVGEAYASLMRSRRLAALYNTSIIPQAEATMESAMTAYKFGSVDFMTLLEAQIAVSRYRQELITLEVEEGKAWAVLEMLTAMTFEAEIPGSSLPSSRSSQK